MDKTAQIIDFLADRYTPQDYPVLQWQYEQWREERPLAGVRVLDATPLFANTLLKYRALLAAGAELTLGMSDFLSYDRRVLDFCVNELKLTATPQNGQYDVVMDCAAAFADSAAELGYVELTRSGVDTYINKGVRCYVADSSRIKRLETELGTGDGFFRAMDSMGFSQWQNRVLLIFGSGKVGRGILRCAGLRGAEVVMVTDPTTAPDGVEVVDYRDGALVDAAIERAYCVVMATGVKGAFERTASMPKVLGSQALLANMGAEDEFGASVPAQRVLCDKRTVNFMLDEPTHLRYIDATMALHNYGALYLAQNRGGQQTLIMPSDEIENRYLDITATKGLIVHQL